MKWRTGVTIAVLAAIAATGWWAVARAQAQPDRASLTLAVSGGACGKTLVGNDTDPAFRDRIRTKRGRVIQWTVVNQCAAPMTVAISDWVRKSDGQTDVPVTGNSDCRAGTGGKCVISVNVRANAGLTTYSYSVSINGTKHDPDVVIEN